MARTLLPSKRRTRGASVVEILILVGFIALLALAGVRVFGRTLTERADRAAQRVASLEGAEGHVTGVDARIAAAKARDARARAAPSDAKPASIVPNAQGPAEAAHPSTSAACTGEGCGGASDDADGAPLVVCDALGCRSPGNCFARGTLVDTPSGLAPIEGLHPGDLVLARAPLDERAEPHVVKAVKVRAGRPVLAITIGREEIVATAEHPFFAPERGWVPAGALAAGDAIATERAERGWVPAGALAAGDAIATERGVAEIAGVAQRAALETVYNLEVEGLHDFFVGEARALVHNDCTPEEASKKLDRIDALERENQKLAVDRQGAKTGTAEDRIDDAIARNKKEITTLERELFGGRGSFRTTKDKPTGDAAEILARITGLDPNGRREALARMTPADVKAAADGAPDLARKAGDEIKAIQAELDRVTSPELARLRGERDAVKADADAAYQRAIRKLGFLESDDRMDAYKAAQIGWRRTGELDRAIEALALAGSPPEVGERLADFRRIDRALWALRSESDFLHLPPPLASVGANDPREIVSKLSGDDLAHAWAIWARQNRENDRISAFAAALAKRPDRAEIQGEIDATIADARTQIHDKLPPAARAAFDAAFVAKPFAGDDGKITIVFAPTSDTRRLQALQAAALTYERIEFNPRRTGPYDAPSSSSGALTWWLTYGSTPPGKLTRIVNANHSIRATGDEMILVPVGTLMQAGRVGLGKLVVQGTTEVTVNAAIAVTVEKVAEKYGPAAGAGTPFAVVLTAVLTRRYVLGPKAVAAAPALASEAKAVLAAEGKAVAGVEAKAVAAAETKAVASAEAKLATTYSKADAAALIDASEGRAFGNNVGHARAHVPAAGQDPVVLAMSRPTKENNTVLRHPRHGEQALRDAMNQEKEALAKLKPGDPPVQGTVRLGETVPAYNSVRGAPPTIVHIKEMTYSIVRQPDGSLHLLHFAPRVPK